MKFPVPSGGSDLRIETARLILRLFSEEDFEELFEFTSHPDTFRFSERGPMTSDEAWTRLLRNVGHWSVKGYGMFAVEEKRSGRLIGEAGLGDFRRSVAHKFGQVPEVSWTIAPWAQRKGYATEAIKAALAWAEEMIGVKHTLCLIHELNKPSLRVAKKAGYRIFGHCEYKGYPALLLERVG